jgi:hypothetical protein
MTSDGGNCFIWSCGFCSFKDFVFDDCCFLIGRRIFLFNNAHVYPVHAVDGVEVNDKNTCIKQPSKYSLTSLLENWTQLLNDLYLDYACLTPLSTIIQISWRSVLLVERSGVAGEFNGQCL